MLHRGALPLSPSRRHLDLGQNHRYRYHWRLRVLYLYCQNILEDSILTLLLTHDGNIAIILQPRYRFQWLVHLLHPPLSRTYNHCTKAIDRDSNHLALGASPLTPSCQRHPQISPRETPGTQAEMMCQVPIALTESCTPYCTVPLHLRKCYTLPMT